MWATGDLHVPPMAREDVAERWSLRPWRKRFRHRKRYYRRLEREAAGFRIDVDGWFDLWHTHPDWRGDGNRSGRDRRRHLAAGFTIFRNLLRQARESGRPMQVFFAIEALDSAQDAVYVHTPNPNRDNFPVRLERFTWDVPPPVILREFLTEPGWQLGRLDRAPGSYVVRPRPGADAEGPSA
jgi:hypothetical protein